MSALHLDLRHPERPGINSGSNCCEGWQLGRHLLDVACSCCGHLRAFLLFLHHLWVLVPSCRREQGVGIRPCDTHVRTVFLPAEAGKYCSHAHHSSAPPNSSTLFKRFPFAIPLHMLWCLRLGLVGMEYSWLQHELLECAQGCSHRRICRGYGTVRCWTIPTSRHKQY